MKEWKELEIDNLLLDYEFGIKYQKCQHLDMWIHTKYSDAIKQLKIELIEEYPKGIIYYRKKEHESPLFYAGRKGKLEKCFVEQPTHEEIMRKHVKRIEAAIRVFGNNSDEHIESISDGLKYMLNRNSADIPPESN